MNLDSFKYIFVSIKKKKRERKRKFHIIIYLCKLIYAEVFFQSSVFYIIINATTKFLSEDFHVPTNSRVYMQ